MRHLRDKLILGDTLKVLNQWEADGIDLAITSPPYNKQEKNRGWLVKEVRYDNYKDTLPEGDYQAQQVEVLKALYRVIRPGGSLFYNHKLRWHRGEMLHPLQWLSKTPWVVRQEIIWDRQIAGNIRGWRFWQVDERIYWLHKAVNGDKIGKELASRHALLTSIWRIRPENDNPHPAPFPLRLPVRIIESMREYLSSDSLILDPYIGSGTTGVAAKCLGYPYVGIDNCATYLEAAKTRISAYTRYASEVAEEVELHKVDKTFTERKAKARAAQGNVLEFNGSQ